MRVVVARLRHRECLLLLFFTDIGVIVVFLLSVGFGCMGFTVSGRLPLSLPTAQLAAITTTTNTAQLAAITTITNAAHLAALIPHSSLLTYSVQSLIPSYSNVAM